ncbi:MAG: hypothetical protein HY270_23115, partial [Deltaproteobacteria bacterium]|nr:hypothetical protein [Deltaproteobacteria bacterium]
MNLQANTDPVLEAPAPEPLVLGDDWGRSAREHLERTKDRLFEWHNQGASGQAIVDAYTAVMDDLLRKLFDAASTEYAERFSRLDQRCTVVAQGGYGRAELNPCSDIDLLFLYPYLSAVICGRSCSSPWRLTASAGGSPGPGARRR